MAQYVAKSCAPSSAGGAGGGSMAIAADAAIDNGRTSVLVEHSVATMVARRVFGIALG
jgi:hypothetical protein